VSELPEKYKYKNMERFFILTEASPTETEMSVGNLKIFHDFV
jgi:hypothetical protein